MLPAETTRVGEEILEPLRRVLKWIASLRDTRGRIVCPEHKIEHTGKSAGAIVIACELLKVDPQRDTAWLCELASQQAHRLVANLVREGTSACFTFRPGRHDPFNCSNGVIDGGACSDALAHLVTEQGDTLTPSEREAFTTASLLHARTYLRYAVLDKGIPAQRAWGLTGLAGAYALEPDRDLERAAIEAVGVLEAIQNPDGSYPYHPREWGAPHPGSSDVSAFYQSRVSGFLMYALARMGRDPASALFAPPIRRGLDFVCALQGPDGIKCGLVEAKPWYWGAVYEVASHPFDVYALASGWRLYHSERYGAAAWRAFRAWVDHLGPDGEPHSHRDELGRERSYQCPLFWASHASWIARAAIDLEALRARPAPVAAEREGIDLAVTWFRNAALARIEDAHIVAWVRGARPAVSVHHGSSHGAGLLRVYDKRAERDVLARRRFEGAQEGEWSGAQGLPSLARGWRSGASDLRFSLWQARVHWRAGRALDAVLAPLRVFRRGVLAFGAQRVSSAFDLAPSIEIFDDGVLVRSQLAHRDGSRAEGSALERSYRIDGEGLEVRERLASAGSARRVVFRMPRAARDARQEGGEISFRLG